MTSFLHALFWIYRVVGRHLIRHLHAVTLLALSALPNRLGMVIIVHPDHSAWASTSFRIHRRRAKSSNVSLPVELDTTWRVWSAHKAKLRSSIQPPLVLYLVHLCGRRVWIFKNPSKIVFHCCKTNKQTKKPFALPKRKTHTVTHVFPQLLLCSNNPLLWICSGERLVYLKSHQCKVSEFKWLANQQRFSPCV